MTIESTRGRERVREIVRDTDNSLVAQVERDHLKVFVKSESTAVYEQIFAGKWEGVREGPTADIKLHAELKPWVEVHITLRSQLQTILF